MDTNAKQSLRFMNNLRIILGSKSTDCRNIQAQQRLSVLIKKILLGKCDKGQPLNNLANSTS